MGLHVIVGAGAVGSGTALALVEDGHQVRLVSRSGRGPLHPAIELVAAPAQDQTRLAELCRGAAVLYNCANPAYHRWTTDWPPIAASLLGAAERNGAALVTMGNLYGYGPVDRPMTEDMPLRPAGKKGGVRARMWADALAAHHAGRVRATEARASDFFGPGLTDTSLLGERVVPRLLAGRAVRVIGDPDVPHSWTFVPDVARALSILGTDDRAWGRAWHVPTNAPLTQRELIGEASRAAGVAAPRVAPLPHAAIRAAGLVSPMIRELEETRYQFVRPFVLDSSDFTNTFGMVPTPMDQALRETIQWWQDRARVAA